MPDEQLLKPGMVTWEVVFTASDFLARTASLIN